MEKKHEAFIFSVLVAFCCLSYHVAQSQDDIDFSFMLSRTEDRTGNDVQQDTSGVAPAVLLALDAINNNSNLLEGYRLTYRDQELNSMCDRTTSLDTFFRDITSPPTKTFLLGCGCSIATAPVGEISHFWQIIQLAYASLTPVLMDRSSFPNLYSLLPSALTYKPIINGLMNTYEWKRLVVISQLENEFNELREVLVNNNTNNGIQVVSITFHSNELVNDRNLFTMLDEDNNDYRIYFLNMYEKHARRVICQAYLDDDGINYPRYVFIVPGTYHNSWWSYLDEDLNCTQANMEAVLNRTLVIASYPTAESSNASTDVDMTYKQFKDAYDELLNPDDSESFAAPFAYDALWAIAFAMNQTNAFIPLTSFDTNGTMRRMITQNISRHLDNLNFTGLTGPVSFNENGVRNEVYPRVLQYRFINNNTAPVLIGTVNNDTGSLMLEYANGEDSNTVWPITVPTDGTPITELRGVLLPVFVYLYIVATAGVVLCIICAIVNFVLRKKKVIRLTSPNLNYLIILGCFLMIVSAYLYAYPFADYNVLYGMCIVRAYTQNVGYMLCFGTVCAKMGRVYFIFHNTSPSRKRKSIQDWHLIIVVLLLSSVDVIIATVSLIVDDYKPIEETYTENPRDTNDFGIQIDIKSLNCSSERSIIWIGMLFLTKFAVQLFAVFFAFKTRKVKIKALNDAKTIAVIIYVTTGLLTILVIAAIALDNFLNTDAGVFGSLLVIFASSILLMLFIPKWYNLYKDPEGKNIFEGNQQTTANSTNNAISEQDVTKLVSRIEELEERLSKHEAVTPSQPRKRFLSSTGDLTRGSGVTASGLQGLRAQVAARGGGRSMSYSPTPVDTTASLPPKMLSHQPSPAASPLVVNNNYSYDSGSGTMTSTIDTSGNDSPQSKIPAVSLTIPEDEDADERHQMTSSQTPLTASTNF